MLARRKKTHEGDDGFPWFILLLHIHVVFGVIAGLYRSMTILLIELNLRFLNRLNRTHTNISHLVGGTRPDVVPINFPEMDSRRRTDEDTRLSVWVWFRFKLDFASAVSLFMYGYRNHSVMCVSSVLALVPERCFAEQDLWVSHCQVTNIWLTFGGDQIHRYETQNLNELWVQYFDWFGQHRLQR